MARDRFKKQAPKGSTDRIRRQIAVEAARRIYPAIGPKPDDPSGHLGEATEAEYYAAKRKAAAVLGHAVRPGDLPSDGEVREEVLALARSKTGVVVEDEIEAGADDPEASTGRMADHLDRFAIYRLRLLPLEAVKQPAKSHPEGDALYHSLQVFERARDLQPNDEEFLTAALLHDVGKAIDPRDRAAAGVDALRGAVTDRTLWLIARHMNPPGRPAAEPGIPAAWLDDLVALREVDEAGRAIGAEVGTVDEALDYLKGLADQDEATS